MVFGENRIIHSFERFPKSMVGSFMKMVGGILSPGKC